MYEFKIHVLWRRTHKRVLYLDELGSNAIEASGSDVVSLHGSESSESESNERTRVPGTRRVKHQLNRAF